MGEAIAIIGIVLGCHSFFYYSNLMKYLSKAKIVFCLEVSKYLREFFLESHCYFSSGIHHPAGGRPGRASLRLIILHARWFAIRSWGPSGWRTPRPGTGVPINSLTIGLKKPIYGSSNVKKGRGAFQSDGLIPNVINYQNVRLSVSLLTRIVHSIDGMKSILGDILEATSKVKILLGHQCPDRASLRLIIFHARWFAIRRGGHPDGGRQGRAFLRLIILPLSIPYSSFGGSTGSLEAAWIKGCGVKLHPSIWFHLWVHRGIISPSGWNPFSECIILITISIGNVKFHRSSRKACKTLVVLG
jgi:hypothetical protein